MITLTASASYGKSGQYIARITGRDSKFTFAREFIGRKGGKRQEETSADVDEPGLYECCDIDKRGNKDSRFRVIITGDCDLTELRADKEEAMTIAKALDGGRKIEEIIGNVQDRDTFDILTGAQATKAKAAQTIDSATEACWQALGALPVKDAKKVLAALKARLTPPAPVETAQASEATQA